MSRQGAGIGLEGALGHKVVRVEYVDENNNYHYGQGAIGYLYQQELSELESKEGDN